MSLDTNTSENENETESENENENESENEIKKKQTILDNMLSKKIRIFTFRKFSRKLYYKKPCIQNL